MPEQYRILIQPRVAADLEAIHHYISHDSPQNAASFIAKLIAAFDSLQAFPTRYSVYEGPRRPRDAVRRMPVSPYLVYYRVRDDVNAVDIITVRHGARKQPRRFP